MIWSGSRLCFRPPLHQIGQECQQHLTVHLRQRRQVGTFLEEVWPSGFCVEDDRLGIPEDKQEKVLESKYSSREKAAGLGLSITKAIAEAHERSISAAESREDGARFEFHGVEFRGK